MSKSTKKHHQKKTYTTGSTRSGTFVCTNCEGEINLKNPGRLPPCYKCSNTKFYRKQEAEMTDIENAGNYLRTLRLGKGMSTKDVTEATRISETNLTAIEDQNFSSLPADTFTRGLVTIYAEFLGADPEAVVARFMEERNASPTTKKQPKTKSTGRIFAPKRMAEPTQFSSMTMATILFVIIVVSFAGYCYYTSWNPFAFLIKKNGKMHSSVMEKVFPSKKETTVSATPDRSRDTIITIPAEGKPQQETATDKPPADEISTPEKSSESSVEAEAVSDGTKAEGEPQQQTATDKPPADEISTPEKSDESDGEVETVPDGTTAEEPITGETTAANQPVSVTVRFAKDTSVDITQDENETVTRYFSAGESYSWQDISALTLQFAQPNSAEIMVNGAPVAFPSASDGKYKLQIPLD